MAWKNLKMVWAKKETCFSSQLYKKCKKYKKFKNKCKKVFTSSLQIFTLTLNKSKGRIQRYKHKYLTWDIDIRKVSLEISILRDFFLKSNASVCFLFINLMITLFLSPRLYLETGRRGQPSMSLWSTSTPDSQQICITSFSNWLSGISLGILLNSTLFLLLYCSDFVTGVEYTAVRHKNKNQ